jgi:Arc-like DNA binding domain
MIEKTGQSPSRKLDQLLLRFPDGLRAKLTTAARANHRTLTAEIVQRLQTSLLADEFGKLEREEEREFTKYAGKVEALDAKIKQGWDEVIKDAVSQAQAKFDETFTEQLRRAIKETIEDVLDRWEIRKGN